MRLGIVADDLTGAMDAAAPFADLGMQTAVLLDWEAAFHPAGARDLSVLSIDTHTRDGSPTAAADAVCASMARVTVPGTLPFKKIDSTLRGQIAVEIRAALEGSGRSCALIAPAAPAQGRTLRDGYLFVNGKQVGDGNLADTLRASMPDFCVRSVRAADRPVPLDVPCVYVADADSEHELDLIAAHGLSCSDEVLLAGSSGLASAIARRLRPQSKVSRRNERRCYQRLWFVVGSHNARSAEQVRALLAQQELTTIVLPLADEPPRVTHHGEGLTRLGLVHVEGLDATPTLDPQRVAAQLAEITAQLLDDCRDSETALFMTGGDTARAVLSRLRVDLIDVLGTQYPGIVHGRVPVNGQQVGLLTKAGGFGQPDLFLRLAADLLR